MGKVSYSGLQQKLHEAGVTKSSLIQELGISSRTIAKISRGEKIAHHVLERIALFFDCSVDELCQPISENKILQTLREEKDNRVSGGLYHELQIRMTYNSNHIEGSRLSEDQTRMIFETNTIDAKESVLVDDIVETINHFRAIDYCIDVAEQELTEGIIKELHRILEQGIKASSLAWFAVGDYKKKANVVGGRETTDPEDVPLRMKSLLAEYETNTPATIDEIVDFHYKFERIRPFQDGNGRVGRLIAFKECLRFNIVPFIIEDQKKMFYYRGLMEWEREPGYLRDTCLDGQDTFKRLLSLFEF